MTIASIKSQIWHDSGNDLPRVKRSVAACQPQVDTVEYWQWVHRHLLVTPVKTKPKARTIKTLQQYVDKYNAAHYVYTCQETPAVVKDGHYCKPIFPKISTSAGLTRFVINHLTWCGCYANRINTTGRQINGKWITGTTKKGTGDTVCCIGGKMIWLEIKIGRDKPSEHQLRQQSDVRKSGGEYFFIKTPADYFEVYEKFSILAKEMQ